MWKFPKAGLNFYHSANGPSRVSAVMWTEPHDLPFYLQILMVIFQNVLPFWCVRAAGYPTWEPEWVRVPPWHTELELFVAFEERTGLGSKNYFTLLTVSKCVWTIYTKLWRPHPESALCPESRVEQYSWTKPYTGAAKLLEGHASLQRTGDFIQSQ